MNFNYLFNLISFTFSHVFEKPQEVDACVTNYVLVNLVLYGKNRLGSNNVGGR